MLGEGERHGEEKDFFLNTTVSFILQLQCILQMGRCYSGLITNKLVRLIFGIIKVCQGFPLSLPSLVLLYIRF
jgi:hypothetical protein